MALVCPVILGSVRSDRQGLRVARFLIAELEKRGWEAPLVDPGGAEAAAARPHVQGIPEGRGAAGSGERSRPCIAAPTPSWWSPPSTTIRVPPALSNTLDHFLEEYFWRPSAICCYSAGQYGGVRAAMQLRAMLAELGMPSIPSLLPVPRVGKALDEAGTPAEAWLSQAAGRFLDELTWYAEALKAQRQKGTPY